MGRSANRSNMLVRRGGTIAAAATAIVLGGSGMALAATGSDVGSSTTGVTSVTASPTGAITGLVPTPSAQSAPAPTTTSLTTTVTKVVTPVVRTVTSTVQTVTTSGDSPPTGVDPKTPPKTAPKTVTPPKNAAQAGRGVTQVRPAGAVSRAGFARLPAREADANLSAGRGSTLSQQPDPAVAPMLAPAASGSLADVPGFARHGLPILLFTAAAAILAALAGAHLGLWWSRRYGSA